MLAFDNSYLNKTPNKTQRTMPARLRAVVWHETASPSPDNPYGTLEYNLTSAAQSSYNYLIARDGAIFHYVDERGWVAWHAGKYDESRSAVWVIDGTRYVGIGVNSAAIGVEVDGPCDGTPITPAQRDSILALMRFFRDEHGIPLDAAHHIGHKELTAPTYRTDPRGYSVALCLQMAQAAQPQPQPPDLQVIGVATPAALDEVCWRAMERNRAPISQEESGRIAQLCRWLDLDFSFLVAVWAREGGRPFGSGGPQPLTRCWINIKAASTEWRDTALWGGERWLAFESYQLGGLASALHLKQMHGTHGRLTVRQIAPVHLNPLVDDVEAWARSVMEDMAYIRAN